MTCKRWDSFYDLLLEEQVLQWEILHCGCDCIAEVQARVEAWQLPVGLYVIVGFGVFLWKSLLGHNFSWQSCQLAINVFNLPSTLYPWLYSVSLYPCKSGLRNSFVEVCPPASPPVLFSSGEHAARAGWTLIRHCMGWWDSSSLGKKHTAGKKGNTVLKTTVFWCFVFFRWEENVLLHSQFTNRE